MFFLKKTENNAGILHRVFLWVFFFSMSITSENLHSIQWETAYVKNGIEVYRQKNSEGGIVGMRGKTVIDAPVEKIISILLEPNYDRRKKWFENLLDYRLVEQSSPLKRILHIKVDVPWPLLDRDFVYSALLIADPGKKTVVLSYESVENIITKQQKVVRGQMESIFTLTSIENGTKTIFDVQSLVDPEGIIPKNIVNMVQKNFAYDMLINLRKLSIKPEIKVLDEFKDIMNLQMVETF